MIEAGAVSRYWLGWKLSGDALRRVAIPCLYVALAMIVAAMVAALHDYPVISGKTGAVFFTYANPFKLDWGLVHLIVLLPTALVCRHMLAGQVSFARRLQPGLLLLIFGCLVLEVDLMAPGLYRFPPSLFIGIDAGLLLVLSIGLYPSTMVLRFAVAALAIFVLASLTDLARVHLQDTVPHEVLRIDKVGSETRFVVLVPRSFVLQRDCPGLLGLRSRVAAAQPEDGDVQLAQGINTLDPGMLLLTPTVSSAENVYELAARVSPDSQCQWHLPAGNAI